MAIAVLVGVLLLLVLRQPLSDWLWPDTRGQQLRADAAQALAEGRLTALDGRGARELYEAALALDPDRPDAREGLARVGEAALAKARADLAARRYADAHAALALARELAVPRARTDALARELREREAADAGIDELLAKAGAARAAGRYDGAPDSALALYQRVLELQPARNEALEGREDTLADLLQLARADLERGELAAAAAIVRRAQAVDAGHVDLPDTLDALARAVERRRANADAALRRSRLAAALAGYRAVLAAAPDDADAARGILRVGGAYARRSERLSSDFDFDGAAAALRIAESLAPDASATSAARQHLQRARRAQARLGGELPTAERRRRLAELLRDAAEAESRGDLLSPPGESAYDRLRAARAIAPQDRRVRAASARLLPAARACFDRELRGNRLQRARECLDARQVLEGESAGWREDRRRLAQRWMAVGDERLGAGEVAAAQAALASARALDPDAPGLDEFAERLRAARSAAEP
ncbi:hypothetical protein [Cognatilysobacter tabacisoli]|uniref:hypothetical protein n=1 Tax=Cognatilysobacter tabacisoli TaxID=2315424 RepID=UPI000E6B1731